MSDTKPPAPSKWAMEAAKEIPLPGRIAGSGKGMSDMDARFMARERNAAIITRHHAAAQAETVALLEDAIHRLRESNNCMDAFPVSISLNEGLAALIRTHLAQLKKGAP